MMNSFLRLLSRFSRDQNGVVAIIFALALIPLLGAGGAAIDYSRAYIVQSRLANALDATALAMGSSAITDEQALKEYGQKFFDANYPADKLGVPSAIQATITDSHITVTGTAQLPTSLMGLIGINHLGVNALAEVTRANKAVEVAMVLDNSGSMAGAKLVALKASANLLMDSLFGEGDLHNPNAKIALVPFSSSVNVGTQYENSGWIDKDGNSSLHGVNFSGNTNIFSLFNKIKNRSWGGCVEARSYPMDVRDTAPTSGDTLWVPYFQPDEPDYGSYGADYLKDKKSGSYAARQMNKKKYEKAKVNGGHDGPNLSCPSGPIIPLTNDKNVIQAGISNMVADGGTLIPMGMAWGWRVLSPQEPFTQGSAYENKQNPTVKGVVLMSDGANSIGGLSNHNKSWYGGYGYLATQVSTNRLNVTTENAANNELDDRVLELCQNVKDKGIVVFTVSFELNDNDVKDMMQTCASDAEKYFDAENATELKAAFKTIGKELGELRLSQ